MRELFARPSSSRTIGQPLARIDYVKAVDGLTMQQIDTVKKPMLVALAVYIGKTRLIDNFIVD